MRPLELQSRRAEPAGRPRPPWSTNDAIRKAERALALQAQRAYERTDQPTAGRATGCGRDTGARTQRPSSGTAARQTSRPLRFAL